MHRTGWLKAALAVAATTSVLALSACGQFTPTYLKPLSAKTRALLAEKGMTEESPILVRIFKAESELEVWKAKDDGRFYHFKTYPICDWSGKLGPKQNQGDRQTPEGFYLINEGQMNPKSKYHLAFNVGFPNSYDRSFGRTGADIMVHGDCKSAGCFAMTDAVVEEIYILARESLSGDQSEFQLQAYPFRMTTANMAQHKGDQWYGFWQNLKEGYDYFEVARLPVKVDVCDHRYVINASFSATPNPSSACPSYQRLPVIAAPKETKQQQAKAEIPLSKPLGSVLGLSFGPAKPVYQAFTLGPATPMLPMSPAPKK
ncbi:MAG: murein L,D-transpeptidase [Methyloceanibacter sp.]|nr:murein L,D-transpeptidase [Methyloceanibacter sp.]